MLHTEMRYYLHPFLETQSVSTMEEVRRYGKYTPGCDDIGSVIECDELEDGVTQLECLAKDTMQLGFDNRAEFEVSKTEVLLFSGRRKVL